MSDTPTQEAYVPDVRADVDRTQIQPREQKYEPGERLMKKNAQGLFVYSVTIVSATYDAVNNKWKYTVKDYKGKLISGTTDEKDLQ
ncbi:MAG: hypothetical protein L6R39_001322 [Caloplaca ligustica]|nr:MAG: hypothetical protein L6R39_001322 [Caloplaca ligustica]